MTDLEYLAFDADNHYYEATDAFTRHIDPKMAKRCMQWADIGGKQRLIVAGRINRFIPNPTFDPVAKPGILDEYFRAKTSASDMREAFGELDPISPAYRNRDERLALMDSQGLGGCFMFPTLGVGMEACLEHDVGAITAAFGAFNRWLDDDWGFSYQERLFTALYLSLADVDWALGELEWAVGRGLRVVNFRASSVPDGHGNYRSLGHPDHDPVWQFLNDHGVCVSFHSGDSGYSFMNHRWGLGTETEAFRYNPLQSLLSHSPISDTMASLLADGVLVRFPNLRVATIETGSYWVRPLIQKLAKTYGQHRYAFDEDPVETFRNQVWVSPYYEDDLHELAGLIGTDHMLFGSDYPHAEGLADPVSFVNDLDGFSDADVRRIMCDNGAGLSQLAI